MKSNFFAAVVVAFVLGLSIFLGGYGLLISLFFAGCAVAAQIDKDNAQDAQKGE